MTLIQASLLQQERVDTSEEKPRNTSPKSLKEKRRETTMDLVPVAMQNNDCTSAEVPKTVAGNLQQLVAAMKKLSDLDKALDLAQEMKPTEDGEALKWHRMSLTAVEWTRKVQSEHVQALLRHLKSAMLVSRTTPQEAKAPSTNGGACAWPNCRTPEVFSQATDGRASSADEAEASLQSDSPAADELGETESVPIGSLRNDLEKIRDHDPSCCLIVRNIKRLGLESSKLLYAHFARLGEVEDVCVAHSFEKPNAKRTKHRNGRVRPAALGFIVMATKEDAQRVLDAGSDQLVDEVTVNVRLIEPFTDKVPRHDGVF